MKRRRNDYRKQPSAEFGGYLKKWREDMKLSKAEAARQLQISSKKPGSYLGMIEKGDRAIPDIPLSNVPRVYCVTPEEVIRRAYSPQLPLPFLTAIMAPTELPKAVEDFLKEFEKQLEEEDKTELTRYAAFLLLRRHLVSKR